MAATFGKLLRRLRTGNGIGIKRLAPELGVSYTYLSKLENSGMSPSEDLVGRVAQYFRCDQNELLLSAGRIPPDVLEILQKHPTEAIELLKRRFGNRK